MKYRKLVAMALPVIVETEAENERLLAIIEPMMSRELSPEEEKLFDLLVKLVEDFEQRHYLMGESSPTETLKFLMEQRDLRQRDIVHLFGSSFRISPSVRNRHCQFLIRTPHGRPRILLSG